MVKNKLDPDWPQGESNTFEFDLSKGELTDVKITLKDWNRLASDKELGTAYIRAEQLDRLMAGKHGLGDEFLVTGTDGNPLIGKSKEQTFLVLKLKAKEGLPGAVTNDEQEVLPEAVQVGSIKQVQSEERPQPPPNGTSKMTVIRLPMTPGESQVTVSECALSTCNALDDRCTRCTLS